MLPYLLNATAGAGVKKDTPNVMQPQVATFEGKFLTTRSAGCEISVFPAARGSNLEKTTSTRAAYQRTDRHHQA